MGGIVPEDKPENERKLLLLLPMLSKWIQTDRRLTDNELAAFIRQYPEHYNYAADTPLSRMMEMVVRHKNHKIYGKDVATVLSPEGQKWLEDCLRRVREYHEKHK